MNRVKLSRRSKRVIFRMIDLVIIGFSIFFSFSLRFDIFTAWSYAQPFQTQILLFFPIKILIFWGMSLYRSVLRFTGIEFAATVFAAVLTSNLALFVFFYLLKFPPFPRSIWILDAMICFLLILFSRFFLRWFVYIFLPNKKLFTRENILIYGAGNVGCQFAQALAADPKFKLIGFIDDNPQLDKQVLLGVKVYDRLALGQLVEKYRIDSILLAIPSATNKQTRMLVEYIGQFKVKIKTVPGLDDILSGKVTTSDIHQIDIADLLGREEVAPHQALLLKNVAGATVLITGAGGSIGSELCRQIALLKPKKLVLLEQSEFSLYQIQIEISERFPKLPLVEAMGDMGDQEFVAEKIRDHQVDTIFHAAAYKHVPLVETNPKSGIKNNVLGSLACILAAKQERVKNFVLISTDKAVRPTNIMGATKRITELIVQAIAALPDNETNFIAVRFGNVLGSSGSVVPRFRKQIAEGKNITVTHPDITRYFMSISEAARLVIQASALGTGGEIFLLDMGEPIKIYDLAQEMIFLSGLTLGEDIDIDICGLRPGEKLHEELLIDPKQSKETEHPKIFYGKEPFYPWSELQSLLEELKETLPKGDEAIKVILKKIVPEYNYSSK
ncbi:MAG: nucleoside-diphosphate sugar epimerase/dehydratase [SAR324 cluster bacterium]|nr:nucleoside-diphosphate sugar epimerase/dehydratase [SAR324 cluster bacterium]